MSTSREDKIQALYEAARARPADEREAFLKRACEEEAVREDVASLLEARAEATGFFETLADAVGASMLREEGTGAAPRGADPLDLEGTHVRQYVVEEHLGGGGMGIVYRARDRDLGRTVALKFLPPRLSTHPEAEERFLREAKAAAALEHSHVATVHEIGETEQGRRFLVMAYYEGETLRETLDREGSLPPREAIEYARQVAEALARAHEAGIVHRDVKPANVMVTARGEVKLLDFGLARILDRSRLTDPGRRPGTAAYMSPEQADGGETVDARADLWALGVLLYEMLTGTLPFEGDRPTAVLHAILHDDPAPIAADPADVPARVRAIVERCLQKDPDDRYPSAEALLEDLRRIRASGMETTSQLAGPPTGPLSGSWIRGRWGLLAGAAALLLLLGTGLAWALWPEVPPGTPLADAPERSGTAAPSIAVLPFEVSGAGTQTWRDGMVTVLSTGLDGAAGLRTIPPRTVFATWKQVTSGQPVAGRLASLAAARRLNATYAVTGSAVAMGGKLRLDADVYQTASGRRLGTATVRGRPERVMGLADALARRVLGLLLKRSAQQIPSVELANLSTESLPALKAFLNGERHFRAGAYAAAAADFERATQRDSSFALAYARLERALGWSGGTGRRRALQQACERSDSLPPRDRRLLWSRCSRFLGERDLAATDTLRRMSEAYPQDPQIWYYLGESLFHGWSPGGWTEAERALRRAVQLDPKATPYREHLADVALSLHRDSALAARHIAAFPDGRHKNVYRAVLDLVFGGSETRRAALARLDTLALPGTGFPYWVRWPLLHPRDLDVQARVIRTLAQRAGTEREPYTELLTENRLLRGQVEAARALLRENANREEAGCLLAATLSLRVPLPDSLLRSHLGPGALGPTPSANQLFCRGIYLVERGRADRLPALLSRLKGAMVDTAGTTGWAETRAEVAVRELRGYRAWKAGRLRRAVRLWRRSKWSWWWWGGAASALWRGDLYRALGQFQKAESWYRAARPHPLAHERLGRLYDTMGFPEKARVADRRFIEAWKNADPGLQDRVEQARRRVQALPPGPAAGE